VADEASVAEEAAIAVVVVAEEEVAIDHWTIMWVRATAAVGCSTNALRTVVACAHVVQR
jgi:hypothetical protein